MKILERTYALYGEYSGAAYMKNFDLCLKGNQLKIGIFINYLIIFINTITQLVYTPILLRILGQSEYGLYQLVYSVVSYLSILSFGFSSSYIRYYSKYNAKQDEHQISILNGMYLSIFLAITGTCLLCGYLMVTKIECIFSDGLTVREYVTARNLMILMVVNLAFTLLNSVFDSIILAHEQFVFQRGIVALQNLLNPFLSLLLLLMGYGSIGMVSVATFLTITRLLFNVLFCIRKLHVHFSFHSFNFGLLKEIWIFTFFIFFNSVIDQINWNVDKFLLGRLSGTTSVAVYGVGSLINTLYLTASTSVSNVFVPQVNRIVTESDNNWRLTQLFTKVGRIQFIILVLILYVFSYIGFEFIDLWAGADYEQSYFVALLLIVPVTIPLIQNLGIEVQRAKNMHKTRSIVYFIIAIANIFISIPCIKQWGAPGAAVGTAISLLLGNGLFMNWYYQTRIGLDMIYFWKEIIKFIPALLVSIILGAIVRKFVQINGWLSFGICALLYVILFSVPMWLWGLNDTEKGLIHRSNKRKKSNE